MGTVEDVLIVGYDLGENEDISILAVAKINTDGTLEQIKVYKGLEAEHIYQLLKGEK